MYFIYSAYDHIFYLYYTWRHDMFESRNLNIFQNEFTMSDQPSWKKSNLYNIDEYCLYISQIILPTISSSQQNRPVYSICLFKYSLQDSSFKKYMDKKWALLNHKHNDMKKRVLAQLILRGDYGIWNA